MEHESDDDTSSDWSTLTIPKWLVKGQEELDIRGKVETIQTTALRPAKILRSVLETEGELLSL